MPVARWVVRLGEWYSTVRLVRPHMGTYLPVMFILSALSAAQFHVIYVLYCASSPFPSSNRGRTAKEKSLQCLLL